MQLVAQRASPLRVAHQQTFHETRPAQRRVHRCQVESKGEEQVGKRVSGGFSATRGIITGGADDAAAEGAGCEGEDGGVTRRQGVADAAEREAEAGPGGGGGGDGVDVVGGVVEERPAAPAAAFRCLLLNLEGQYGDEEDGERGERGEDDGGREARCQYDGWSLKGW